MISAIAPDVETGKIPYLTNLEYRYFLCAQVDALGSPSSADPSSPVPMIVRQLLEVQVPSAGLLGPLK